MDGSFEGKTQIADFQRVHVEGDVTGFDVRKLMRVYNGQSVPWDAAASGPMQLSVTFGNTSTLQIAGRHGDFTGRHRRARARLDRSDL